MKKAQLKIALWALYLVILWPVAWAAEAAQRTVILPFENVSAQAEHDWLAQSFAESLTLSLGQMASLELIERSQIQRVLQEQAFNQSIWANPEAAPQLGQILGAQTLVLGSYQIQGELLKVQLRFVDAETGQIVPNLQVQVQGQISALFELQQELTQKLSVALQASQAEQKALAAFGQNQLTSSVKAYKAYLQGLEKYNQTQFLEALLDFKQAIQMDPQYPLPYAAQAETYASLYINGTLFAVPLDKALQTELQLWSLKDCLQAANQNMEKAQALAPQLPYVQRTWALVQFANGHKAQALDTLQQIQGNSEEQMKNIDLYLDLLFEYSTQVTPEKFVAVKKFMTPYLKNARIKAHYLELAMTLPQSEDSLAELQTLAEELIHEVPGSFLYRYQLAKIQQMQNQSEAALATLQAGQELFFKSSMGSQIAAYIPMQLGRHDLAQKYLDNALQLSPDNTQVLYFKALNETALKNLAAAKQLHLKILRLEPGHIPAKIALAQLETGQKQIVLYEEAVRETRLQQAQNRPLMFSLSQVISYLGFAYSYDKQYIKAAETLLEATEYEKSSDYKAYLYKMAARYLSFLPEPEPYQLQRVQLYQKALSLSQSKKNKLDILLDLVVEYSIYQNNFTAAEKLIQEALLLADAEAQPQVILKWVDVFIRQKKYAEAETKLKQYYPDHQAPAYFYALADIYAHQEDYVRAAEWMRRYLEASPQILNNDPDGFYVNLYRSYVLEARLSKNPKDISLLNDLGVAYMKMEDYEAAALIFQRNLKLEPENATLNYNLGTVHVLQNQWEQAIVPLEQATRLKADYAAAWYNLGLAYLNTQKKQQAKAAFVQLRLLDPNYPGLEAVLSPLMSLP